MKPLKIMFSVVLVTMIVVTSWASLSQSILQIPSAVTGNPWFIATMFDAYFGFLTFYAWVWYRSPSSSQRLIWFILIMLLGNMAMAAYMLIRLFRLPAGAGIQALLLHPSNQEEVSTCA